ncbi:hypothetical protein XSP_003837 [Xanthomonas euroxanthea]|uniref:TnsA endonuclease N-terminal domain-containing protein n=1 Tax=Xanthomonas euroxanthea TaxID=2259622 RepID=A0A8E4E8S5_9XANT|nr:TnsA endonuclease N-terminal domain-containing protein [Xanthomonas euroxanthea]CAD1796975.1 hypothetical protein XSP_003837 [Xanthomonas euroxanthea]SYZ54827.1 hypothetical protein CPBF367_23120 [Xanthomonas arboricola pv. juglandis]
MSTRFDRVAGGVCPDPLKPDISPFMGRYWLQDDPMPAPNPISSNTRWADLPRCPNNGVPGYQLYIEPPAVAQIRVRRLVHRGAPRPVYKFWSIKLNRIVQCESLLEVEVGQLLDASPGVTYFGEQPVVIHYFEYGQWQRHIPDFCMQMQRSREFIEVKYTHTVDQETERRTNTLTHQLARHGWGYRLLTESEVHRGPWLSNAQVLLRRGREAVNTLWSLHAYEQVRQRCRNFLGDFGWTKTESQDAVWIANELIRGTLLVDRSSPLTALTPVTLPSHDRMGRALPW